jgi:NAD(P)H-dependent FMN reductase
MAPLKAAGIPSSPRKNADGTGLLRATVDVAPPDMHIDLLDFSEFLLFNPDIETVTPESVREFKEAGQEADAAMFDLDEHEY